MAAGVVRVGACIYTRLQGWGVLQLRAIRSGLIGSWTTAGICRGAGERAACNFIRGNFLAHEGTRGTKGWHSVFFKGWGRATIAPRVLRVGVLALTHSPAT